jgi:hypothetical protein
LGQTNLGVFFSFPGPPNSLSHFWRIYFFSQNEKKKIHQTFMILKRFFGDKK